MKNYKLRVFKGDVILAEVKMSIFPSELVKFLETINHFAKWHPGFDTIMLDDDDEAVVPDQIIDK